MLAAVVAMGIYVAAQTPLPQEIVARAFDRLHSYPLPPYAVWSVTRTEQASPLVPGGLEGTEVYKARYALRLSDGMENASAFPSGNKLPPALIVTEFQGPFAWSMRAVPAPATTTPMLQPDIPEALKTIAHVTVHAPDAYTIENSGIESVEGHQTYHLRLTPRTDPARHNLRDLWVDVETFDLWKAHFIGRYAPVPSALPSESDVTVYFLPIGPYWVVLRMDWTWDDAADSTKLYYDVLAQDITFPSALPDWLFDRRAYADHLHSGDADYLAPFLIPSTTAPSPSP